MIDRHSWRALRALLAGVALALLVPPPASAQLRVDITSGVTDPVPVAIVPFQQGAGAVAFDYAQVVEADLARSGRFRIIERAAQPARPSRSSELVAADWRTRGVDYVLVAAVSALPDGGGAVDFELVNVLTGQRALAERVTASSTAPRAAAHRIADRVYQAVLGIPGPFATRIAYVSVDGVAPNQRFQLIVADADGEGARVILESRQPIMSPAWSPDGDFLAYVSFEARVASIYVQRLRTGQRSRVSARVGINGAPSWSPDGRKLAITLSGRTGNLDLYLLDLATQQLQRVTDDAAIDTEAMFAPDGSALYFTSDRSGAPQIYRQGLASGERARRITFSGSYNARPRISPDGRRLAFVTREEGAYRVAIQELDSGAVRVLSRGRMDESPAFAPNGDLLIYAGRERGQGVLATVSADGLVAQRLKADRGEVREPAWGPFAR
jgi:TolB protein